MPVVLAFSVQVKVAVPDAPVVSVAVTVMDELPTVVGVLVIRPVLELMLSPAGRPVALYVSVRRRRSRCVDLQAGGGADGAGLAAGAG